MTGLVVDSGFGLTQILPICENFLIKKGCISSNFYSGMTLNENI